MVIRAERGAKAKSRAMVVVLGALLVCVVWLLCHTRFVSFASSVAASEARRSEAEALRANAWDLVARGEVGEAIQTAERAAALAPMQTDSWALLGSMHAMAGHSREARTIEAWCVVRTVAWDVVGCRARTYQAVEAP